MAPPRTRRSSLRGRRCEAVRRRAESAAGYLEDVATFSPLVDRERGNPVRRLGERVRQHVRRRPAGSSSLDRSARAWSPRLSTIFALPCALLTASAYRASRAPTLNELYRPFRLGGVLTLANPSLDPETLVGAETGARFQSRGGRLSARANFFWTELRDAVGNVTIFEHSLADHEGTGKHRTRAGSRDRARSGCARRLRLDGFGRIPPRRIPASSPRNAPELVGKRVPQVPRDQVTGALAFSRASLATVTLQARWSGPQYDDDLNAFRLGSAFTLDARSFPRDLSGAEAFVAGENLTDRRNDIGRTPCGLSPLRRHSGRGLRWRI